MTSTTTATGGGEATLFRSTSLERQFPFRTVLLHTSTSWQFSVCIEVGFFFNPLREGHYQVTGTCATP